MLFYVSTIFTNPAAHLLILDCARKFLIKYLYCLLFMRLSELNAFSVCVGIQQQSTNPKAGFTLAPCRVNPPLSQLLKCL